MELNALNTSSYRRQELVLFRQDNKTNIESTLEVCDLRSGPELSCFSLGCSLV